MDKIPFKFIPLTFISKNDLIKKQIINTIVFRFVLSKYDTVERLENLIEGTQYGYTASAKSEGNSQLLRITDIKQGKVNWQNVPFCNCDRIAKYELEPNDILIARTGGTTGKSFIIENPPANAVFASYLIRIRVNSDSNSKFINAFLNNYSYWSQISDLKRGAAQPNVNAKKLSKILVPTCPKDIQDKLVKFLDGEIDCPFSDLEKLINKVLGIFEKSDAVKSNIKNQQNDLSQLRQAILQEAIQGKLVPQDPTDEPASVLLERIKAEKAALIKAKKIRKEKPLPPISEDEIPFELPDGWVWCRLGEVTTKIGSGSTPRGGKSVYVKNGIKFFRSQNIYDDGIVLKDIVYIDDATNIKMKNTVVKPNDLLLNITGGSIGRCALTSNNFDIGNVSQHVCIIRPTELNFSNFLHKLMLSTYIQQTIANSITGAGREGLPKYKLEQFLIPLPPLSEQNRIVQKVEALLSMCEGLEEQVQASSEDAEVLMQAVLQEAFG